MSRIESDVDYVDRISRKRATLALVLPIFLFQQAIFVFGDAGGERLVDHVRIAAWVLMTSALLLFILTGGFLLRARSVRALLNDEVAQSHRSRALALGFAVAMIAGIGFFAVEAFRPGSVGTLEALHIVVSLGLGAALVRFGMLERKALG